MYKVKVVLHFSAAHFLRNYKGKCESLHGHNWRVEVVILRSELNSSGMVIDFIEVKKMLNNVLNRLDHHNLNDLEYFKKRNPSCEEIARYIFDNLSPKVARKKCILEEVRLWETENSGAIYQGMRKE